MLSEVHLAMTSSLEVTEVAGEGGQHSPRRVTQPSIVPFGPIAVAHASYKLVLAVGATSGSLKLLVSNVMAL